MTDALTQAASFEETEGDWDDVSLGLFLGNSAGAR